LGAAKRPKGDTLFQKNLENPVKKRRRNSCGTLVMDMVPAEKEGNLSIVALLVLPDKQE
jgi:hypothetical protein